LATAVWISLISAALIVATSVIHFEILAGVTELHRRNALSKRVEVVASLISAFLGHLIGIGMYAATFAWLHHHPEFGELAGRLSHSPTDFFYFSVSCYTTLGFGDVYATEDMRIISGVEGLNGLVLIAWSAAFTYRSIDQAWNSKGGQ
jgi:hypothetical protein